MEGDTNSMRALLAGLLSLSEDLALTVNSQGPTKDQNLP
jgi:hypothetical protein